MDNDNIFINFPTEATEALNDPQMAMFWKGFEHRTFWVTEEIGGGSLDLVDYIIMCNREDHDLPIDKRRPIKLFINSVGGSLDVADTLINVIKLSKTPIYAYAMGMVASAASLIYLSCHKRYALPNAYLILHQGSCSNMGGSYSEIEAAMEDYRKQVEKMTQFYIDNTSFTEDEVRTNIKTDWYLYVDEALAKGIATDIITDLDDLL